MHTYMNMYKSICIHICMCICINPCTPTHSATHTPTRTHTYIYPCIFINLFIFFFTSNQLLGMNTFITEMQSAQFRNLQKICDLPVHHTLEQQLFPSYEQISLLSFSSRVLELVLHFLNPHFLRKEEGNSKLLKIES